MPALVHRLTHLPPHCNAAMNQEWCRHAIQDQGMPLGAHQGAIFRHPAVVKYDVQLDIRLIELGA